MGRSKINIELIQDHKNRKNTFLKRKAGLIKKISELSILCDIKACMIILQGDNHHQHDEIWPNDSNKVEELINLYKNEPLAGRSKRAKNLSDFLKKQKKKSEMIKAEKYPTWDSRFDYLSEQELQNLAGVLEKKMKNAKGKSEFLKSTNIQDSNIENSSLHPRDKEIWDYPELMMNNNNNNLNQTTATWPISNVNPNCIDYNNFFQENIPSGDVNSMGAGMNNGLLTIDDYQFDNWLESNKIGSTSTSTSIMQPTVDEYPFMFNGSTHNMPYGFQ